MNKNAQSEELKMTLEKCTKNLQEQLHILNGQFLMIHEHLHGIENKLIAGIIGNSKNLLENINKNDVWQPLDTEELKQNVHSLILNCEIACTYEKLRTLEEKTNDLYKILEDRKILQNESPILENMFYKEQITN